MNSNNTPQSVTIIDIDQKEVSATNLELPE